jgi:tetratricopeptide (TPR) repeat protein
MVVPARDPSTLSEVLGHLAREGVAESLGDDPEGSYRLAHDLLRQVVYETTSHALREQLHRRLVHCLDTAHVDPVEVAEHVHATGDASLARRWFPLAAQAARESWNLTAAVRWWEALHPLLDGSARERAEVELLEVLLVAGRANDVLDRVEGADAHRWSAVTGNPVPVSEDGLLSARRLLVVAEATYSCGRLADTEEAASRVMELADGVDEPRYQRAGELLTLSRCHQGDVDGALRNGRALVDRATRSTDPASRANASAALGAALVLSGNPEAAQGSYEAALTWAVEAGDVVRQVHVLSDLAGCAYLTGRRTACVELLGQAREAAESIGYRRHLALNLNNEAQLRAGSADPFATSCAAVAVDGSLELGDLPTAADALHTWLTAKPSLAADPGLWHRLAEVDVRLGRFLEAAGEWAELAVALGRSGRREEALEAARRAEEFAQGPDAAVVGRRAAYARIVADAHAPDRPRDRARLLAALDVLADGAELDERETAEIAVERWRLSRRQPDRGVAVARVSEAFEVEPSALVRSWFRTLREPLPAVPKALPPPVGIRRGRATRRDLELALLRVERAAGAHWTQEQRRPSAC